MDDLRVVDESLDDLPVRVQFIDGSSASLTVHQWWINSEMFIVDMYRYEPPLRQYFPLSSIGSITVPIPPTSSPPETDEEE